MQACKIIEMVMKRDHGKVIASWLTSTKSWLVQYGTEPHARSKVLAYVLFTYVSLSVAHLTFKGPYNTFPSIHGMASLKELISSHIDPRKNC